MKALKWNNEHAESHYRIRVMGSIIIVELILIVLFNFWPVSNEPKVYNEKQNSGTTAIIETPVITRQSGQPPPPPSPRIPVEVPDEVIIEEQNIEFLEFNDVGEADKVSQKAGTTGGNKGKIYKNPESDPSILYIVEPTIENKTDKKALIYVRFLIDKKGKVQEAAVDRILLFNNEGKPTIEVKRISERVLAATIKAAFQWKFRPAKVNGQPVRAFTLQTFTIDY